MTITQAILFGALVDDVLVDSGGSTLSAICLCSSFMRGYFVGYFGRPHRKFYGWVWIGLDTVGSVVNQADVSRLCKLSFLI